MRQIKQKFVLWCTVLLALGSLLSCSKLAFTHEAKLPKLDQVQLKKKPKLALVLGGGGAKGLSHLGVLYELKKAGITPDLIIGCSAGAIIGAMYTSHDNIPQLTSELLSSKRDDVIGVGISSFSMYSNNKFMKFLRKHIQARTFADLRIPLVIVATSLEFGDLVSFSTGPLIPAIMASASIPGAFHPVKIAHHYYIDGGVASPVPVSIAKSYNPDVIVAIDISEKLPTTSPTNIVGLMRRALEISYIKHAKLNANEADLVINFDFNNIGAFSDQKNQYLYNAGLEAGRKAVPQIKALMIGKK